MATIAFTAIGAAIGGPIGGLIGSAIGQRVDKSLFGATQRREGPRLKELAVQTSSYGTQIPALFGAMRVSGSVIWSTDIVERRSTSSGGKGRPSTTSYTYSVSMAVALSSRPVLRVGRIWAEGNLLRGAEGDFKVETDFRFHQGHLDQLPDPLIVSAEGALSTPAFRGVSYAVFENLQLADFGNRIPSLTFELFERDDSVLLADIFSSASHNIIEGMVPLSVVGYSVQGESARSALAPLLDACGAQVRGNGKSLVLFQPQNAASYQGSLSPVVNASENSKGKTENQRLAVRQQPVAVSLRYYDPQRDYQIGLQRSGWSTNGLIDEQLDLPAALDTGSARAIAENLVRRREARRDQRRYSLAISENRIEIGQAIGLPSMRVFQAEHFGGYSVIDCANWPDTLSTVQAQVEPGRHLPSPDVDSGQTLLEIAELPSLGSSPATEPILAIAAGGTGAGWRRATIMRTDGPDAYDIGAVTSPSAIGVLQSPVSAHPAALLDDHNILTVLIETNAAPPEPVTSSLLAASAPLLKVGNELIRYSSIEPLGSNIYAVRNLVRGFGFSSPAGHVVGERVVFIDKNSLFFLDAAAVTLNSTVEIQALGLAESVPVNQSKPVEGLALKPVAPVHGRAERLNAGGFAISWIRRARHDTGWVDGVDLPQAEMANRFELSLRFGVQELLRAETSEERFEIDGSQLLDWSLPQGSMIEIAIRQIGIFALSDPLLIAFEL